VGEWDLTWTNAKGETEKGTNRIVRILDEKVIQENFSDGKNSYRGTSLSVYNPRLKTWNQTWADNQGGYIHLEGLVSDGKRMFQTQPTDFNGTKVIRRMVFFDIKANSFTWNWEQSQDGGKTWALQWKINYKRKEKM
jgi:hypothetical protein